MGLEKVAIPSTARGSMFTMEFVDLKYESAGTGQSWLIETELVWDARLCYFRELYWFR